MDIRKSSAGKASILALGFGVLATSFVLGKSFTSVFAHDNDGYDHDSNQNKCIPTSCGSDQGTKTVTQFRDFDFECPDGFQNNPDHDRDAKDCRKVETQGHFSCSNGWVLDGNKCKKHDHRDQDATWINPIYSYSDNIKVYKDCDRGWSVDGNDSSKCVKTESCNVEGRDIVDCPTPTPEATPEASPTPEVTPTPTPSQSSDNSGSSSSNSNPGAPVCNAAKPGTPTILSAVQNGSDVTLTWSADPNATYYSIVYGDTAGSYNYGAANVGNVTTYTIHDLKVGTVYHFGVIAVNDCMPGDTGSFGGTGGQVLGASTMAGTGSFDEILYSAIMSIGATLTTIGVKGLKKAKKASKK